MGIADEMIIGGVPLAIEAQAESYLYRSPAPHLTEDDVIEIVYSFRQWGKLVGIRWDVAYAQSCHETNRYLFGNQVRLAQRNPAGIGATNDGAEGLTFPSWRVGAAAYFVHLLAWCDRLDLAARIAPDPLKLDPRIPLVARARATKGKATTWASLGGRWAVPGVGYGAAIERHHNAIVALPQPPGPTKETSMAPTITQKLTPVNHWEGRNGNPVEAVVMHVSEGGKAGVESWFKNPASEASAHYLVNKDGTIWQFVREQDTAWANGKQQNPNLADPLIKKWHDAGINPNRRTIAVETERFWQERLTPPQLASLVWLCADLHARYKLPTDGSRLLGHNEIDSVDRARCPSLSAAEWSAIVAGLGKATPPPVPPQPNAGSVVEAPAAPAENGAVRWYLNDKQEPIVEINFGGRAKAIEGVNLADVGVSVIGTDDATYDRSLQGGAFKPYTRRTA